MADVIHEGEGAFRPCKRKRAVNNWRRNALKRKQAMGEEFEQCNGSSKPARTAGPPCSCRRQCFLLVSSAEKAQIIANFNGLGSKDLRDAHLFGFVSRRAIN